MDMRRALLLLLAIVGAASFAAPAGAFIGTGINLNKHLGDTINFNVGQQVNAAGAAFGLAGLDMGVTWGVDYDLSTLAGYPFGYGGVGAITDANIGYNLGVSLNEAHGIGYDASPFGLPLAEGSIVRTSYNNFIANNNHIQNAQIALPFFGFPVL